MSSDDNDRHPESPRARQRSGASELQPEVIGDDGSEGGRHGYPACDGLGAGEGGLDSATATPPVGSGLPRLPPSTTANTAEATSTIARNPASHVRRFVPARATDMGRMTDGSSLSTTLLPPAAQIGAFIPLWR